MERKHFFTAAVLILLFAIPGCTEITPPEFNNPRDPLNISYPVPAPSNLSASFNSSTEVLLGWGSWGYEKGYIVERSVDGGEFKKVAELPALAREYVDSGLDTTKAYAYRVKRFTENALSPYSRVARLQPSVNGVLKMKAISSSTNFAGAFAHDKSVIATVTNSKFNQIIFWKAPQYIVDDFFDHAGKPVKAMSFSADDKLLACGTEDSSIYFYDVNSKKLSFTIKGIKEGMVASLDFSPNGRFMAVAAKNKDILVYDTNSWTVAYTLSGHTGIVNSVCFNKDGSLMASAGADGTIILWNTTDWTAQRTITTGESSVMSASFSPDGRVIAAAAGMNYYQYETATGNKLRSFSTGGYTALSAAFSNDGSRFAGACGKSVSIYDSNNRPFTIDYGGSAGSLYSFNSILAAPGDGVFITVGYPVAIWLPAGWTISYQ